MLRIAKPAKVAVNIGIFLFVLLLIYLLNSDEGQFNPELRDNVLSDYDYYMEGYKDFDKENYEDLESLVVADVGKAIDSDYIDAKDGDLLVKAADDRRKVMEELVIVVVGEDGTESEEKGSEKSQPLDTPSEVPENREDDVLRENDVLVDGVVIDKSEDLYELNTSDSKGAYGSKNTSVAFFSPVDLLPFFKKPSTDRDAPGEFGHPFAVPSRLGPSVQRQVEEGYRRHAFNVLVSDLISVHRNLGDKREDECKTKRYRKPMPTVSIVICFHNEAISTLLRTLYSVLESVPGTLLNDIILVDDNSHLDLHELIQAEIEDLMVVEMIRSPVQVGIAQARMLGVQLTKGDVLVFLDSHCECYEGWLEPLLERIKQNRKVVALPIMDIINPDNFKFSVTPMQRVQRGGFDWSLTYRWIAPPRERFKNPLMDMTMPIPTPTMSGGVFAVDKKYFLELGNFDDQMQVWGGENLEMSFRVWMCGGRIEILPCSHVGHVFKSRNTHGVPLEVVLRNKKRVAEVWLDNYKSLFYKRTANAAQIDAGNLTSRYDLKKNLGCKSFKWYIDNVYPDLYVPELKPKYSGALCCRFGDSVDVCLDTHSTEVTPGRPLGVDRHQKDLQTQYFEFTKQNEIRQIGVRDICMAHKDGKLEVQKCKYPLDSTKDAPPSQQWIINKQGDTVTVTSRESDLCLAASTGKAWLEKCDLKSLRQKWRWI